MRKNFKHRFNDLFDMEVANLDYSNILGEVPVSFGYAFDSTEALCQYESAQFSLMLNFYNCNPLDYRTYISCQKGTIIAYL
jgi:hypothetical protein